MIIKWHGEKADSKYSSISKVLHYFEQERKNVLVRMDYNDYNSKGYTNYNEVDIFIPKIKISNLILKNVSKDKYHSDNYAIFTCEKIMQNYLLKMFYNLSILGDPGHSFNWKVDDICLGWDGDGSDRILEINCIENWKDYAYTKSGDSKYLNIENLSKLILFNKIYDEIYNSYQVEDRYDMQEEISLKAAEKAKEEELKLKLQILDLSNYNNDNNKSIKESKKLYERIVINIKNNIKAINENDLLDEDTEILIQTIDDLLNNNIYEIAELYGIDTINEFILTIISQLQKGKTLLDLTLKNKSNTDELYVRVSNKKGRTFISVSDDECTGVSEETPYPFNFNDQDYYDYEVESLLFMLDLAYHLLNE